MELYRETDFYTMSSQNEDHIVAVAKLTNGVVVLIRENGTAMGTDGHIWAHVSRQIGEDEYEELGWTRDCTRPVTLRGDTALTQK